MAQITLLGAAGEVTGSAYLVTTRHARVLVDFGMFQGGLDDAERNVVPPELDPHHLDAVVLTHGHMDHTGRLPLLPARGYHGPIFATPATIELAELLLYDSARLQEGDTRRENQRRRRADLPPLRPLYDDDDVGQIVRRCRPLPYDRPTEVAPGVRVRMVEAGHLLGSASVQMLIDEGGPTRTVAFSGDIGPRGAPFLKDPELLDQAELVFLESTYGDRDHRPLDQTLAEFAELIRAVVARSGKLLVPAFAVGRSQQILYHLAELFRGGAVPEFPIYLDSPMAIRALELYFRHPELADSESSALRRSGQLQHDLQLLTICESPAESRALNDLGGPCMIIAGSGMCTGGRILHHLKHGLWQPENALLIVGYQAERTLGRQLAEGASEVQIFGEPIAVRASVHTLGGFSAHAGQSELLAWLAPLAAGRPRVALTHGEERGRAALAALVAARYGITPLLPSYGDQIEL